MLEFVDESFDAAVLDPAANAPDDVPPMPWFAAARNAPAKRARAAPDPVDTRWPARAPGGLEGRLAYRAAAVTRFTWAGMRTMPSLS
ncbi:MAG: hypothetical protein KTR31_18015 [Myxococcales bacterium]|nr:hypothetical protein [Myxococcales bacterium]